MSKKYQVTVEFSVGGYVSHIDTFTAGTLAEIKAMIAAAVCKLGNDIDAAQERDGDLRAYCPQFANGYPTVSFSAELGSDFNICILTFLEEVMTTVEVRDERYTDLCNAFG